MNISQIVKKALDYTKQKALKHELSQRAAEFDFVSALKIDLQEAINEEYQPKIKWHRASELPAIDKKATAKVVVITNAGDLETGSICFNLDHEGVYTNDEAEDVYFPITERVKCWCYANDIANTAGDAL